MAIYRIPVFEGLNTANQEHLLRPSQATELKNARADTGSLVSTKAPAASATTPDGITFNPDGNRSVVKFNGKHYFTDNVANTQGSEDGFLGLDPPFILPTAIPQGTGSFTGIFKYAVTFETEDNIESAPININEEDFSIDISGSREILIGDSPFKNATAWQDAATYNAGDTVRNAGKVWVALSGHRNLDTTEGAIDSFELGTARILRRGTEGRSEVIGGVLDNSKQFSFDPDPNLVPRTYDLRLGANVRVSSITATTVTGELATNFQYDFKRPIYFDTTIGVISEPGVGATYLDFWEEIGDDPVTAPEIRGSSSFLLTGVPISEQSAIVRRNIYRTISNGENYYRVGSIEDNILQTFVDDTSDAEAQLLPTLGTEGAHPPLQIFNVTLDLFEQKIGKFLTERNGIFFLALDNRVYFSEPENPHTWNPLNSTPYDDEITAMARTEEGILVFTKNRTYIQLGDSAGTTLKREIPRTQGCQNFRTISFVGGFPIWVSNDGICVWTGQTVEIINDNEYDLDFIPLFGEVADDAYYLFGADKTVVIDFRHNRQFYERDLKNYTTAFYDLNLDQLFLKRGNAIEIDGTGPDEVSTYATPEIDAENFSQIKNFRKIWIEATATYTISVLFGGVDKQTIVSKGTGRRSHYLVPGLTGNSIKFRAVGSGTFKELSVEYAPLVMA